MSEQTISLDQKRAAYAWECVSGITGKPWFNDYANLAKAAPALIMNNGLMQVLAFYWDKARGEQGFKKDKEYYAFLLAHVLKWLHQQKMLSSHGYADAMKQMHTRMSAGDYRLATHEALELLKWIRTLAPTVKKSDDTQEATT